MKTDAGTWRSSRDNIGSGETELIAVDGDARDGRIHSEGQGMERKNIELLYAEGGSSFHLGLARGRGGERFIPPPAEVEAIEARRATHGASPGWGRRHSP